MGKRKISDFFAKPSTLSENSNEDSVINTPKKRKTNELSIQPNLAKSLPQVGDPPYQPDDKYSFKKSNIAGVLRNFNHKYAQGVHFF